MTSSFQIELFPVPYLAKILQKPKNPTIIWTKDETMSAPCTALMDCLNL